MVVSMGRYLLKDDDSKRQIGSWLRKSLRQYGKRSDHTWAEEDALCESFLEEAAFLHDEDLGGEVKYVLLIRASQQERYDEVDRLEVEDLRKLGFALEELQDVEEL